MAPTAHSWMRPRRRILVAFALALTSSQVGGQPAPSPGTIVGCAPRALTGETVCVCGEFRLPLPAGAFQIDGRLAQVVSAQASAVTLQLPADLAPGTHSITGAAGITGQASVEVIAPRVQIEVSQLEVTQRTYVHVSVEGTRTPLPVHLTNGNPAIVALEGGDNQHLMTGGGAPNETPRREVKAGSSPGDFGIRAEIELEPCPCGESAGPGGPGLGGPPGGGGGGTRGTPGGGPPVPGAPGPPEGPPPSSTPPGTQALPLGVLLSRDDDNWIPAAELQADCPWSGGTPLTTLTARLYERSAAGWTPTEQKRPITIRFTERSKEKGRALNKAVLDGPIDGPDLYFPSAANQAFRCDDDPTGEGFFGRCTTTTLVNATRIVVQAADFGAFGVADATCPGCTSLVALADGTVEPRLTGGAASRFGYEPAVSVPRDMNRNGIADAARLWERSDPTEDTDAEPASLLPGDGMTAYEEYRGFYVGGCHIRTDPEVKDLFVVNLAYKLGLFRQASGLQVWELALELEWRRADRVVNFNRGHASIVDQHGLRLVDGYTPKGVLGMVTDLGPPRRVARVIVDKSKMGTTDETVAHELGHAVGMHHHGNIDVEKIAPPPAFTPERRRALRLEPGPTLDLAHRGDQGSGDYSCIMRYPNHGDIVADPAAPGGYCVVNEWHNPRPISSSYDEKGVFIPPPEELQLKTRFCTSPAGTGPNANNRCQGDAGKGGGDCKSQLVVSDAW